MEWKHPGSPTKKKFKIQSSGGNVMLTVFWDSKGPILEDYLEKGRRINSAIPVPKDMFSEYPHLSHLLNKQILPCRIGGSHNSVYEEFYVPGHSAA
jgi:hypothetical protein